MTTAAQPVAPTQMLLPYPLNFYDFQLTADGQKSKTIQGYYYEHEYASRVIVSVLEQSGFKKTHDFSETDIIVGRKPKSDLYNQIKPYQKINHYQNAFVIGTKSSLHKQITKMVTRTNIPVPYHSSTYILPDDAEEFSKVAENSPIWIQKPVGRTHNYGIKLHRNITAAPELGNNHRVIMQKYCQNPLLYEDRKIDLRFYAACVSLDPLLIYLYDDGQIRVSAKPYDESSDEMDVHLTTGFEGCFIENFSKLPDIFENAKIEPSEVMTKVEDAIASVIASSRDQLRDQKNPRSSFELWGFDILITLDGGVFVLEANVNPGMGNDDLIDFHMKMWCDLFNLCCIPKETLEYEKTMTALFDSDNKELPDLITLCLFEIFQDRRGNFRCIYPCGSRSATSTKFLENPTQADITIANWVCLNEEKKADKVKNAGKVFAKYFS